MEWNWQSRGMEWNQLAGVEGWNGTGIVELVYWSRMMEDRSKDGMELVPVGSSRGVKWNWKAGVEGWNETGILFSWDGL